jgi:hypothetical protein
MNKQIDYLELISLLYPESKGYNEIDKTTMLPVDVTF